MYVTACMWRAEEYLGELILSTMWILGIELRSLGLLASIFICWAILLALRSPKRIIYHLFMDLLKDLVIFLGMTLDI